MIARLALCGLLVAGLAACGASPASPAPVPGDVPAAGAPTGATTVAGAAPSAAASAGAAAPGKTPPEVLPFLHDDMAGATARAKAEGKALFVDAWAPWCHTCLSMKSYVLTDPSLKPLADRAIFLAIDTDREDNAAFLERHAVSVWPTFFVLDPQSDRVVGYWPGSASAREMRGFVEDALHTLEAQKTGAQRDPVLVHLTAAREAHAKRQYDKAASEYGQAVKSAEPGWPRRSEALLGWVKTLKASGDTWRCAKVGRENIAEVQGAGLPGDFAYVVLECADKLGKGSAEQTAVRQVVITRLRAVTENPAPESSPDDRADALATLADVLLTTGDKAGARQANEKRLAIMEAAAAAASTPQMAATYDYGRALAYVALGRGEEAVRMLVAREKEMPDSYEPPGRLADVLTELKRFPEALAAVDRAIPRAYGPRKLRYLKLKSSLQGVLGDRAGQVATLKEEVAGYQALSAGQNNPEKLADARARLRDAERGAPR